MILTAAGLNRATLARQLLLHREPLGVVEAVRRVGLIQAQSPASPYLALWNRLTDFDPATLDRAYADHAVVKATLVRQTLHAVAAEDYPSFHRAVAHAMRRSRLGDRRFTAMGVSDADVDALVPELLGFAAQARTGADFEAMLTERVGVVPRPGLWWALRTFAPLVHATTGGPWSFGERPAYLAAPIEPFDGAVTAALPRLVRRYLEAFGPASVGDIAGFTKLARALVRAALDVLGTDLQTHSGPDDTVFFDVPGGALPPTDTPAPPRLMAMWDSILLAYQDRSRIIPPEYRTLVIRSNGDVLPTLLVDGHVAGVWRPAAGGIEATAFHRLNGTTWDGLGSEAAALVAFLAGRQPEVYRRHTHWWETLPYAERRLLPG